MIASTTDSRKGEWEDKVWENQDKEGAKWGIMSVISFLPVFNWLVSSSTILHEILPTIRSNQPSFCAQYTCPQTGSAFCLPQVFIDRSRVCVLIVNCTYV